MGARLRSPSIKGVVFETQLDTHSLPYLADHQVEGRTLLPMSAFLEIGHRAAREVAGCPRALVDVTILEPLELRDDGASIIQIVLENDSFEVFSQQGEEWRLHATGRTTEVGNPDSRPAVPGSGGFSGSEAHYARLAELGFGFGPAFRTIESLRVTPGETWVRVCLPQTERREPARYLFHPSLLDGCLQAAAAGATEILEGVYLPFSLERLEMYQPVGNEVWARAFLRRSADRDVLSADIEVRDDEGSLLARVAGLLLKRRSSRAESKIYSVEWREAVRGQTEETSAGKLLILSDDLASGEALAKALRDRGCDVRLARADHPLKGADGVRAVIRMIAPDVPSTLTLVQEMVLGASSRPRQLWLITRGAVATNSGDRCEGIRQAPVWGMARTIAMEHPELRCVRVDLESGATDYGELAGEIANWDGEEEIAFRGGIRYVPRLAKHPASGSHAGQWTIPARGSIEGLVLAPLQRRAPAAGEVEVEVEASALNFRDVLNVLGMYPGDPGQPGIDFCGRVARVGSSVACQPGDRAMGLAWGALASFVTTPAALTVRAPAGWEPVDAAAVPNAFLTAWHCLVRLGRIQRGERVLIHAGTGGVGLAAIQVAQQAGAEIFATAGSEEKRAYLRSLGSYTHSAPERRTSPGTSPGLPAGREWIWF